MKRACQRLRCSLFAALMLAGSAVAQVDINSSPNVVGSGARALGMGGAFIAIADDATSASWNPGGLTQLERPELSLVLSHKWLGEDFNSGTHPELDGGRHVSFDDLNYASFVYPIKRTIGGRNLVLSLNYQAKYDFDRDVDIQFYETMAGAGGTILGRRTQQDMTQRGGLATISPAFGFEITDRLSAGIVVNLWDQSLLPDNEWSITRTFRTRTFINNNPLFGAYARGSVKENYDNFSGTNYTFGVLYRATERLNIGAVYHTKFTADVDYTRIDRIAPILGGFQYARDRRKQEITFPSAIGLGVAYRFPNDKLTLSLDITRREWDQFVIEDTDSGKAALRTIRSFIGRGAGGVALVRSLIDTRKNRRISGVTGGPASNVNIDPTYTVRFGGEYVFVNDKKPRQDYLPSVRAGIFYDPEPSSGRSSGLFGLNKGDGNPDDYFGIALGLGLLIKDRVNIDLAYTYHWGNSVRVDSFGLAETDANVDQHLFYLSTVIYF